MDFSGCFDLFNFLTLHSWFAKGPQDQQFTCHMFYFIISWCVIQRHKIQWLRTMPAYYFSQFVSWPGSAGLLFGAHGIGRCHLYTICFRSQSSAGTDIGYRRHAFVLLSEASFPPVSRPASLQLGGWIPSMWRWRWPLFLRARSGPGTLSLPPHCVVQREPQIPRERK